MPDSPIETLPVYARGLFTLPESEYRRAAGMNQSALKVMRRSPLHFFHSLSQPPSEPSPAMVLGLVTEAVLLTPNEWQDKFVTVPDDAPSRPTARQIGAKKPSQDTLDAIAWWTAFDTAHKGKRYITVEVMRASEAMAESVIRSQSCSTLLTGPGSNQVSAFAPLLNLAHPPLLRKALIDRLPDGLNVVVDFKTCRSAAPAEFSRSIHEYGYDVQAAWYLDVLRDATESDSRTVFAFVCVEAEPPYATATYILDPEDVEQARLRIAGWIGTYHQCVASGRWPGYQDSAEMISVPKWAKARAA